MSSESPEATVVFIDRSFGKHAVPNALRAVHPSVRSHDDEFPQDAPDETWLAAAGDAGWIVLTRDDAIRYHPAERAAIRDSGTKVFVFSGGNMTGAEMADVLVKALPAILDHAEGRSGPFLARVNKRGEITDLDLGSGTAVS